MWKRPTSKNGMHVFVCDYPHYVCEEEFRSASVLSVLAKQLIAARWTIVIREARTLASQVTIVETLNGSHQRHFLCPKHSPIARRQMPERRESG